MIGCLAIGSTAWRNRGVLLHANVTGHVVNLDTLLCDTVELRLAVDKGLLLTKMPALALTMHLVDNIKDTQHIKHDATFILMISLLPLPLHKNGLGPTIKLGFCPVKSPWIFPPPLVNFLHTFIIWIAFL